MRLTAAEVRTLSLPKGKRDIIHFDDSLPGFGFRLRASGSRILRSWICQYRVGGRSQRTLLGSADVVSAEQAKTAAKTLLAKVALGHDPQGEKAAKRQQAARTVRSVVDSYLDAKAPELRPESLRVTRLYLAGSYFRPLHPLAVSAVTRADVATCIRGIVRKHSVSTGAAARRALSAFFAWSIAEGLLGDGANPVDGSHRPDDPAPREHVLSPAELAAVWRACGDDDFGRIVRLLILLGSRRGEVGGMCWSELDLDAGTWTLPAARSKNHRALTIAALPPAALAIIRSVPRCSRDQLFGNRGEAGFTGWSRSKLDLDRQLAGTVRPWRIHDIRRSVATGMADIGIAPHHVEACLNHFSGHRRGVAGIYNRAKYEIAIASALLRWSEHVLALIEGRESNVIALQRA